MIYDPDVRPDRQPTVADTGHSALDWMMYGVSSNTGPFAPTPSTSPSPASGGPGSPAISPGQGGGTPSPPNPTGMPGDYGLPVGWVPPASGPTGPQYQEYPPAGGPWGGYGLWGLPPPTPPPTPPVYPPNTGGSTEYMVPFGGYRQGGGPAYPGAAYVVGENGPELFSPQSPGTVIPYNGGSMPSSSFGMTGIPGANPGGNQVAVPTSAGASSPAVGGATNPLLPTYPSGQSVVSFPANTSGTTPTTFGSGFGGTGSGSGWPSFALGPEHDFQKAMLKAGFGFGVSGPLYQFLKSGAGFNPQVAQALINSMQPYVQRGEADILEQFSNMGLRNGSPAAIGMGDFLSQVNLNEQQVFAQMWEQAVQNYLSVLLSGKTGQPTASPLAGLGQLVGGAGSFLNSLGVGGGSNTGGVTPTPPFSGGGNSFF